MPVDAYLPESQDLWDLSMGSEWIFFSRLLGEGRITEETYWQEMSLLGMAIEPMEKLEGHEVEIDLGPPPETVESKLAGYFREGFREVLVSMWQWTLEKLKALIDLVTQTIMPPLQKAWESAVGKLEQFVLGLYRELTNVFESETPIKPEGAATLATKLYTAAMIAGMGAHGISTVTELLHPLKQIGLHQTAALVGDFSQFGRISGAIIGPLVNGVLGQVMTYATNARHRPNIPREQLLIELRSKREIDKAQFDKAMAYQGFDDRWIDVIERWQWKDPRMFEIIRLADVGLEQGSPPAEEMDWLTRFGITGDRLKDWWLYRKFMRAGYEDCDLDVMVNFIHRREVAFALTYVRTAIRRNYRWGYLTDDELQTWMDRLHLPPKAKEWIFWAGELDRDYFYKQDLVKYYVTAYRNDQLDEDELMVSLTAMNMPARDVTLTVMTEKVKKKPAPSRPAAEPVKRPLAQIQTRYIQLYREQYKKGLISSEQFLQGLLAIDLDPELAQITVDLEVTKRVPEPASA